MTLLTSAVAALMMLPTTDAKQFGAIPRVLPLPSIGGLHFWSDVALAGDWRMQQHAWRRDYRLLDGAGNCHALGGESTCRSALAARQAAGAAPDRRGKVVLLLHGLIRTRHSMSYLARRIQGAGFTTCCIDYASTHLPIEEHAEKLRRIVASLPAADEIDFVCHSMGGLVLRSYLSNNADPRVKRAVLLGTPNYGAERADAFADWALYGVLFGPAGRQLRTGGAGYAGSLPPAPTNVEIGVIAGGTGRNAGFSPLLPGDNDGTVTLASARLEGAADFLRVNTIHGFLTMVEGVREPTVRFLQEGRFRAVGPKQPIARAAGAR